MFNPMSNAVVTGHDTESMERRICRICLMPFARPIVGPTIVLPFALTGPLDVFGRLTRFHPCMHTVVCENCVANVVRCPWCNVHVGYREIILLQGIQRFGGLVDLVWAVPTVITQDAHHEYLEDFDEPSEDEDEEQ
jgi:hypothetical protein